MPFLYRAAAAIADAADILPRTLRTRLETS